LRVYEDVIRSQDKRDNDVYDDSDDDDDIYLSGSFIILRQGIPVVFFSIN